MTEKQLAILELNRKFACAVTYLLCNHNISDSEAATKALNETLADDIARFEKKYSTKIFYDDNYSCTLGESIYGAYPSFDTIQNVGEIVDGGF